MTKPRATKSKGKKGDNKVTALPAPLPAEQTLQLPDGIRWKAKAFQADAERAQAGVQAAQAELQLRQVELQQARKELQTVVGEVTEALRESVPQGYVIAELNPTEGVARCRLIQEE